MAIKPVTNENAPNESTINREEQLSIRSEKGNPRVVIKKELVLMLVRDLPLD